MNAITKRYETITALDVKEGDIVINQGYRCTATNVQHYPSLEAAHDNKQPVARYNLTSNPDETYPHRLPQGYEGMKSGGNKLFKLTREQPVS